MNTARHTMSNNPDTCFECGGSYSEVIEDCFFQLPDGRQVTIKDLVILRCDECHEEIVTPSSSRRIDEYLEYCNGK